MPVIRAPHKEIKHIPDEEGMAYLRALFPDASYITQENFVLFSTSGVHGSYNTIESITPVVGTEFSDNLTFLVIQPRLVRMVYGNCHPESLEDIEYLKALREASHEQVKDIGLY